MFDLTLTGHATGRRKMGMSDSQGGSEDGMKQYASLMESRVWHCCFSALQTLGLNFPYAKPYLWWKLSRLPCCKPASCLITLLIYLQLERSVNTRHRKGPWEEDPLGGDSVVLCFIAWFPQKRRFYDHIQFMISLGNHTNFKCRQFMF